MIILIWLKNFVTICKTLKSNFNGKVRIIKYKNIFRKGYTENGSRKIFIIDSILKTNHWTYKIKDLSRKKNNKKILGKSIVVEYYINELLSKTNRDNIRQ